jgi:hypothetical protein
MLLEPVALARDGAAARRDHLAVGKIVALTHARVLDIDCVCVTTGVPLVMSIVYAPFELPPICRMRPGRYIAVLEVQPPLWRR